MILRVVREGINPSSFACIRFRDLHIGLDQDLLDEGPRRVMRAFHAANASVGVGFDQAAKMFLRFHQGAEHVGGVGAQTSKDVRLRITRLSIGVFLHRYGQKATAIGVIHAMTIEGEGEGVGEQVHAPILRVEGTGIKHERPPLRATQREPTTVSVQAAKWKRPSRSQQATLIAKGMT